MFFSSGPVEDGHIVIRIDGELIEKIPFFADDDKSKFHEFTFGEMKHVGVLEIVGSRVRMLPMERDICPEGICSDTGWISAGIFESIVCMPNRIHVYMDV